MFEGISVDYRKLVRLAAHLQRLILQRRWRWKAIQHGRVSRHLQDPSSSLLIAHVVRLPISKPP